MEYTDYGIELLASAVVVQACEDYKRTLAGVNLESYPKNWYIDDCEKFFRSKWFELLAPDVDPEKTIESLREQAVYIRWRRNHKCAKCKRTKCIHAHAKKWRAEWKGVYICEKENL